MNSQEAKRGFATFLILTFVILGTAFFVNYVLVETVSPEVRARDGIEGLLPDSNVFIATALPILFISVVTTLIRQRRQRREKLPQQLPRDN